MASTTEIPKCSNLIGSRVSLWPKPGGVPEDGGTLIEGLQLGQRGVDVEVHRQPGGQAPALIQVAAVLPALHRAAGEVQLPPVQAALHQRAKGADHGILALGVAPFAEKAPDAEDERPAF
jgi:hypothetical protein